jgi:hypothetical protein
MTRRWPRALNGLLFVCVAAGLAVTVPALDAQGPAAVPAATPIREADAREWLTFLSSDALQGREAFTEGYGMAAAYVAQHLGGWGLVPLGDGGTYFQSVAERTYRVARKSSITIEVNGRSRTFVHGEHVDFPLESGGSQTLRFTSLTLVTDSPRGTGMPPADVADRSDLAGRLVVYLPDRPGTSLRRTEAGDDLDLPTRMVRRSGAAGVVTFIPSASSGGGGLGGRAGRGAAAPASDLTTVEDVRRLRPPTMTADEAVLEFLFSGGDRPFSAWRARAEKGELLPAPVVNGLNVTITIDNTFDVRATRLTQNVVGMVEGADPALKAEYVFFGAHLDHVGYAHGAEAKGRVNNPLAEDRIWNGADDDGSGSVGLMGIARAFAVGPQPRRSTVFVWHAGEETDLLGSRYMVDFPVVPLERVQAMINIDMIGRNRDDRASEADTVYVIGADRISTDLHNLVVGTSRAMPRPLTVDFEYNDPADAQSFYTRSDHYSYARRGIPIAFFFTGTHDDYHANSDTVDKILFPKLVRVAELIYRLGFAVADAPAGLDRDHRGPRAGRGFSGTLE